MAHFVDRQPFDLRHIKSVPKQSGVYVIYDLAGAIYVGRSASDIRARLRAHFNMKGNQNIALARRVGATSSLMFSYCRMPVASQREVEAILIREIGVSEFANLRKEALPADWPRAWRKLLAEAVRLPK